jgi:NAD(P)-dependent dehydrogenase (short-subunit alcohol dehydrogenase family)
VKLNRSRNDDMREDGVRLRGKVAIVTGAGQGGGRGAALALAREGASVVLFGRDLGKLERVAGEIAGFGGAALPVSGDVTAAADRERLVRTAVERYGGVDILVNTAQSPEDRSCVLLEVDDETIETLWASGYVATLKLMRLCHPHMKARGGGSIINFGSGTVMTPAMHGIYAGVKAAVQTTGRAAALEWAGDGIRVNTVLPLVMSPAYDTFKSLYPREATDFEGRIPLRRMGEPEADIGRPVVFLASDDSRFITGSTMALDGGHVFLR